MGRVAVKKVMLKLDTEPKRSGSACDFQGGKSDANGCSLDCVKGRRPVWQLEVASNEERTGRRQGMKASWHQTGDKDTNDVQWRGRKRQEPSSHQGTLPWIWCATTVTGIWRRQPSGQQTESVCSKLMDNVWQVQSLGWGSWSVDKKGRGDSPSRRVEHAFDCQNWRRSQILPNNSQAG